MTAMSPSKVTPLYSPLKLRGDEGGLRLWLRSLFGLGSDGYVPARRSAFQHAGVKFLRPAFAEAASRRQTNNVAE